ncbi:uncharacterized protein [Physcomitrium patens]|uniref:Cyclin-like domain-containing protein n=1 Tax=Physcomitrium patens TaxID=3218 RepID=A0A2K1L2W6_PHYPA|nr:cyclin-T1-4-like isoform X2 [Physcomitrium patens]PNR60367.1 hypothetical protein PHYPA_003160 [Physcomitrium patens]|eukprot:XP_024368403.1 cyclin-T1-4-like isoform X2 [Physcomitrella patens]
MAGLLGGADATAQLALAGASTGSGKLEEPDHSSANWYFTRDEIENQSPSRLDGIDIKKETYFRKSYCTFLQDLGMRLKVPQVTIATAIVFCHRFFHRQSHKKNDRHMVATVCMFLAGKVEETPRPLREVIMFSYEIRFKKDPVAVQKIRQKDVYEEQKELVLGGERLLLTTLGFDLNVHHPYKPLVAAIKKFKVAQNTLAQVAWNFVNDGLRTSLCLQFKPHHIAAGAIFLAAKFLKVNLPKDGDKVWWQQFDVTPRQLEEVSNQMLELYEQNKTNGPTGSLANDPSPSELNRGQSQSEAPSMNGHHHQHQSHSAKPELVESKVDEAFSQRDDEYAGGRMQSSSPLYTPNVVRTYSDTPSDRQADARHSGVPETSGAQMLNERVKQETVVKKVGRSNGEKVEHYHEYRELKTIGSRGDRNDDGGSGTRERRRETEEWIVKEKPKEKASSVVKPEMVEAKTKPAEEKDVKKEFVSLDEVNKDKIKAALEKRRKSRVVSEFKPQGVKHEPTNEEELLERELESGVDAAAEAEKSVKERRDRKFSRGEHDLLVSKDYQSGAKNSRVKEEGDIKNRIEHDVTDLKKRVADADLAPPNGKKTVKEPERKQGKPLESGDHADVERDNRLQRERTPERVEEGEVPSTSGSIRSPPRSADKRSFPDRSVSPGSQKRHYGSRDQYGNRKEGYKDARHSSYNREHYRDHHSSHHRYDQHRSDGDRDRHRGDHKERDWSDRDHKKARHD